MPDSIPTLSEGQLVTVEGWLNLVKAWIDSLRVQPANRCYAYRNGGQTVTAGNTTALNLDTEVYDSASMHSNVTDNNRITVPTAGLYRIHGRSSVSSNNNGGATLHLRKNGSTLTPPVNGTFTTSAGDFEDQTLQVYAEIELAANDYVELAGFAGTSDFTFTTTQLTVVGPLVHPAPTS
jgi:hypothetical protein